MTDETVTLWIVAHRDPMRSVHWGVVKVCYEEGVADKFKKEMAKEDKARGGRYEFRVKPYIQRYIQRREDDTMTETDERLAQQAIAKLPEIADRLMGRLDELIKAIDRNTQAHVYKGPLPLPR